MFPRRYFAGRYFAPRYWPQSAGGAGPAPGGTGSIYPWFRRRRRR